MEDETKAGRRLAKEKVAKLRELQKRVGDLNSMVNELLTWSTYAEESPILNALHQMKAFDVADLELPEWTRPAELGPPMHLSEIKSTDKGVVIGGYMAVWGSPEHRDLQRDYFTPETEFYLDHYPKAPALFHHGQDPLVGKAVLGHRDDAEVKTDGLWVQDWVDRSNRYFSVVRALLDAGKLYYSPGSVPHLVERTADREVKAYPIADDTFTPTPAQFALGLADRPLAYVKSAYKEAGLTFDVPDELRGKSSPDTLGLTSEGEDDAAPALARIKLARARLNL